VTLATSDKRSATVSKLPQDSLFFVPFQLRNLEFRDHVFQRITTCFQLVSSWDSPTLR
jgi:hypothetical protein